MTARTITRNASLLFLMLATHGCTQHEQVNARFWHLSATPPNQVRAFPERSSGVLHIPEDRLDFGICFSGGGTRSASATLGQLRALDATGLINNIGYISSVSGGTWGSTPYMFLPQDHPDDIFLGKYIAPENLTRHDFDNDHDGAFTNAIAHFEVNAWIELFWRIPFGWIGIRDNNLMGKLLEEQLLQPFGLAGNNKFFTYDEKSRRLLLDHNPQLSPGDFLLLNPNRPFYIANGTIRRYDLMPWEWSTSVDKRLPVEMTPLYIGSPSTINISDSTHRTLGSTYVEPLAYSADRVTIQPDGTSIHARLTTDITGTAPLRMNLSELMAISGGAPGEFELLQRVGFPTLHVWSANNPPDMKIKKYANSDGGLSENLGIMPLLARRVHNIIVFVNAEDPGVAGEVVDLFGKPGPDPKTKGWHGQRVFDSKDLERLQQAITTKSRAGESLVYSDTYTITSRTVAEGDPFGLHLKPDEVYTVKIMWFFLDQKAWISKIAQNNPDLADWLRNDPDFKKFPHYATFANNPFKLIDMHDDQVRALSHLTSWQVYSEASTIRAFFNLPPQPPKK